MALSEKVKQSHDSGTITFKDGTGTPLTCALRFDMADVALSGLSVHQREAVAYQSRGVLRSLRNGALQFPSASFSAMVTDLTETSAGTVLDFFKATTGTPYETRVSTNTTKSERFLCNIVIVIEGTAYGDAKDSTWTLTDCDCGEITYTEGEPSTLAFSFTCYGTVTTT